MKKNLLSMIILGLLVVNIVLTTIMLFSITGSNKKTNSLITSIAKIVSLELENAKEESADTQVIPIEDVETYGFEESMTIPLMQGEDGKDHYAIISVALAINKKDKDYKKYSTTIETYESLIKGEINEVVKSHTVAEIKNDSESICKEILDRIQKMYDSEFIFKVVFKEVMCQ